MEYISVSTTCSLYNMSAGKGVAVFCAASESIDKLYVDAANEVGAMLGRVGASLVYGGARFGLMEATAKAAKGAGAHIIGVVPDILVERNRVSTLLDEHIPSVRFNLTTSLPFSSHHLAATMKRSLT